MLDKTLFSSRDLPAHLGEKQKFSLWQDIHHAEVWSVDYATSALPFEADIEAGAVGQLVLGQMAGTIQRASRKSSNIAADGRDGYLLLVNRGATALSGAQAGRAYSVGNGEAALVSASEPLEMMGGDRNTWMNIVVPRQVLADAFKGVDDRLAFRVGTDNEALDLLKRYCQFLETGPTLVRPDILTHAADTIIDLIGLAIGVKGDAAGLAQARGLRAARLQAILDQISRRFTDPAFSVLDIAVRLQISPRYIQDLLQETGESFTERVIELRLQKARKLLASDRGNLLKVTEVAMSCGFNEVSYFHRSFRRRFGATPVQYRGDGDGD